MRVRELAEYLGATYEGDGEKELTGIRSGQLKAHIKRGGMARFAHMGERFGWDEAKMQAFLDVISGKEVA